MGFVRSVTGHLCRNWVNVKRVTVLCRTLHCLSLTVRCRFLPAWLPNRLVCSNGVAGGSTPCKTVAVTKVVLMLHLRTVSQLIK